MFSHSDRFPLGPVEPGNAHPPDPVPAKPSARLRPWGLSRMEPYGAGNDSDDWTAIAVDLDPDTQIARYQSPDGMVSMAPGKHRKTNTGTERATQTHNPGDRRGPTSDQDHSQDHDND